MVRARSNQTALRSRAPRAIRPRVAPALADAAAQFFASHHEVRDYLRRYGGIDLTGVTFPNPFIRGVRFSLATGLHVLAAYERRHLWQAWRVRRAAEQHVDAGMAVRPDAADRDAPPTARRVPRCASIAAAAARHRSSRCAAATIWTPVGSLSPRPVGTNAEGEAEQVDGALGA